MIFLVIRKNNIIHNILTKTNILISKIGPRKIAWDKILDINNAIALMILNALDFILGSIIAISIFK